MFGNPRCISTSGTLCCKLADHSHLFLLVVFSFYTNFKYCCVFFIVANKSVGFCHCAFEIYDSKVSPTHPLVLYVAHNKVKCITHSILKKMHVSRGKIEDDFFIIVFDRKVKQPQRWQPILILSWRIFNINLGTIRKGNWATRDLPLKFLMIICYW